MRSGCLWQILDLLLDIRSNLSQDRFDLGQVGQADKPVGMAAEIHEFLPHRQ